MGIDILGGLPHNFIAKKNKDKLIWIPKLAEEKTRNVPFRDDGEENLLNVPCRAVCCDYIPE